MDKKIEKRCAQCNSDDISFDGSIIWDVENQQYDVDIAHAYCKVCEDEVESVDVEIAVES